jgi:hypothetical protein
LRRFASAGEQDDRFLSAPCEVEAIARAEMYAHFADARSDRGDVAGVPGGKALDALDDHGGAAAVAQGFQPSLKDFGLDDFHMGMYRKRYN